MTGEDDIASEVHQGIIIESSDMKNTHEKADNILVQRMVFAKTENQKGFLVIADDMAVFVLLCFHYLAQKLGLFAQYR